VNDPVDGLLVEREAMDRGFPAGLVLSITAHLLLVGGSLLAAVLAPKPPPINVVDGMAVPLPPGGGGAPGLQAPAPARPEPAPTAAPEPPKPEPVKPQLIKPPKEAPKKGLPELDAKPARKKPTPAPPAAARAAGAAGATGTASDPIGIGIGPPGPGVPGGTDQLGDWYLAGVQRKIYTLWTQQIRQEMKTPVAITFTILGDGSVVDVTVTQSSGISLIDRAAQRAVISAAPFGPLPRTYGTERYTIQAVFRPTS
jgi:TonB family protein